MGAIPPYGSDMPSSTTAGQPGSYGAQTVVGPAWPHVDENTLNNIGLGYRGLSDRLDGEVIPTQASQRQVLADEWDGGAGRAALEAANRVLQAHSAAQKAALQAAWALFSAEAAVVRTKHAVNLNAEGVEAACQAFAAAAQQQLQAAALLMAQGDTAGAMSFYNTAQMFAKLIDQTVKAGLAENTAAVAACATGLARDLGISPTTPGADGIMHPPPAQPIRTQLPTTTTPGPAGITGGDSGRADALGGNSGQANVQQQSDPKTVPPANEQADTFAGNSGQANVHQQTDPKTIPPANARGDTLEGNSGQAGQQAPGQPATVLPDVAGGAPAGAAPTVPAGVSPIAPGANGSRPGAPGAPGATPAGSAAVPGTPGGAQTGTPGGTPGAGQPGGPGQPGGSQTPQVPQGSQLPQTQLPLSAAASAQPLAAGPAQATPAGGAPPPGGGATGGGSGGGVAPVSSGPATASAAAPMGAPVTAAPPAPLGPPPTPSPAAPAPPPGVGSGGPMGPGVAPMGTNQQVQGAAAAPIPVSPARAEKDALAEAARAGLVRKPATDGPLQMAERISAALHAPPSIPAGAWNFVWAVGVTATGLILVANSYSVAFIPDGVFLPEQVVMVSADETIPAGQRGRWVREPFSALSAWCACRDHKLRAVAGTEEEVKPFSNSMLTKVVAPEDIPIDGTIRGGRSRLSVIAPAAAAKLAAWPADELFAALPPQPVELTVPDEAAITHAWLEALTPLTMTTGESYRTDHLAKMAEYGRLREAQALYRAYTAPYTTDLRAAITDWAYWQQFSVLQGDAQLVELGA